jgi:GNAT superfamily N-acetyltransferase
MQKFIYSIRPFAEGDLPALQTIRAAAFAPVFQSFRALAGKTAASFVYSPANAEEGQSAHLNSMCEAASHHTVLVAESDVKPIGFCGYTCDSENKVGEIGLNAVKPSFAGQGVGTALYREALDAMREQGMQAVIVGTGGDESHAPARRAYAKAGFDRAVPTVLLVRAL